LEGRWCLRSTAEIDLAEGVRVRRIALFYPPLVELTYGKPLPPLPTEAGSILRQHGCKLVKILYEFDGDADQRAIAEAIAKRIPGQRAEEPGKFIEVGDDYWKGYWKPLYSFTNGHFYFLYTHHPAVNIPKGTRTDQQSAVLLEWEGEILEYGPPSAKSVIPEAGQPWLAMRLAMLARLPESPTLAMLSFLAP
jgi:hypothetical protein